MELDPLNNIIVLVVQLNGSKMKENRFIEKLRLFIANNLRIIIILIAIIIISFLSLQAYNYFYVQSLKKTSIQFFNSIENNDKFLDNINELIKSENFYSILTKLKSIQKNNDEENYNISNELYKEIIFSNKLDGIYISSISANAAYTLINASYKKNTKNYFEDISFYIENISDDFESYFSIKKELEYLLIVAEIDINNSDYTSHSNVLEIYDSIISSSLISSSIKERVKKIHEFQLYK